MNFSSFIFTISILLASVNTFAQTDTVTVEPEIIFFAEKMPEFPGGVIALKKYIKDNIQYPSEAEVANIKGRVLITAIVTESGSVEEVKIAETLHPLLDAEAIRVVENMPNWEPGYQAGKAVRIKYFIPIIFESKNIKQKKKKRKK